MLRDRALALRERARNGAHHHLAQRILDGMTARDERRQFAVSGQPGVWAAGPGERLEVDERPVTYAHYEDWRSRAPVGVFLTDSRLFVMPVDMLGNYKQTEGFPIDDVIFAGRIRGPVLGKGGAWTMTRLIRPGQAGGFPPAWPSILVPRRSIAARAVSGTFLRELRKALGDGRWRTRVPLSFAARMGTRNDFHSTYRSIADQDPRVRAVARAVQLEQDEHSEALDHLGIADLSTARRTCEELNEHVAGPSTPSGWRLCGRCGVIVEDPNGWPDAFFNPDERQR